MAFEVAAGDHCHPVAFFAGRQQVFRYYFPNGISGVADASDTLINQEVFQQKPAEFVGEFKGLNQALLLQLAEWAAVCKSKR